jgi:LmbE family N-acetylglucosaminyl deacetylase
MHKIKSFFAKLLQFFCLLKLNIIDNVFGAFYYKSNSHAEPFDLNDDMGKRICIFAPHVDDEILGLGGLIKKYEKLGIFVTIIYVTDGRKSYAVGMNESEMRLARIKEGQNIGKKLYNVNIEFLDLKSMEYSEENIRNVILKIVNIVVPDIIYFPNYIDTNWDHMMLAKTIIDNCFFSELRMYSVQTPLPLSVDSKLVEIDDEVSDKISLIKVFESQMSMKHSFNRIILYNKIMGSKIRSRYAENFMIINDSNKNKILNIKYDLGKVKRVSSYESIYDAIKFSDSYW